MPFTLFQSSGKVIALRLKCSAKKGRTQHNTTTTDHASNPVPATRELGLEVSTNDFATRYPWGVSPAREASDIAQLALPVVQAIAGAIPLVGAPMHAVIAGLLTILQAIDRHSQNKADLDDLISRLYRLYSHSCNAPLAWDPPEQYRRDLSVRKLQGTLANLTKLKKHHLGYTM